MKEPQKLGPSLLQNVSMKKETNNCGNGLWKTENRQVGMKSAVINLLTYKFS